MPTTHGVGAEEVQRLDQAEQAVPAVSIIIAGVLMMQGVEAGGTAPILLPVARVVSRRCSIPVATAGRQWIIPLVASVGLRLLRAMRARMVLVVAVVVRGSTVRREEVRAARAATARNGMEWLVLYRHTVVLAAAEVPEEERAALLAAALVETAGSTEEVVVEAETLMVPVILS